MTAPGPLPVAVAEATGAARSAWPELRVDEETFAARLAREVSEAPDPVAALAEVRVSDLYLAAACLDHDPAALRELDRILRGEARRVAAELGHPSWLADEVEQVLRQRLLFPDGETPPRLGAYAGRAALARWIGVAATRLALNLLRDRRKETALDQPALADLPSPVTDPDLDLLRRRYRREFEAAIRDAFAALESPRDRNLLRLYYLERVGLERLGQIYGVHGSTISRWLAAVRQQVLEATQLLLLERLALSPSEIASMFRLVESALEVSLATLLAPAE